MLGLVVFHKLLHRTIEGKAVLGVVQIHEVDADDAAHIAEAQLAGDFGGSDEVGVQGVLLGSLTRLDAVAAIDVNDVHRLGMFDDQIDAAAHGDHLAEGAFDLFGDAEALEDGLLVII